MRDDVAKLRRERDLYLRLLDLGMQTELDSFLEGALALVVELTGAQHGYLEVGGDSDSEYGSRWSIAHNWSESEIEHVRATISRGIIAEAMASGRTVMTPSALLDPRFRDRGSVQIGKIEAVLCVPIGGPPPVGVVYLQARATPGPYPPEEQANAELFARHLAPIADRLLAQERLRAGDPTKPFREKLRLDGIIGRSDALAALLKQVALVAPLEVSVLLTGDSGTGKSQIARVIHQNGPRPSGPFIEVNCGALPETLVESELFGAMPGAHSTATRKMEGKVAAANKGTLFLDEVAELPPSAQAKLLQLLQSKEYFPLGASKPMVADVRLITATNSNLKAFVAEKKFREDLYYRLEVMPIRLPSLAERREDIADLAVHFVRSACERNGFARLEISAGGLKAIQTAEWPGNVRQLAHTMEASAIRATADNALAIERNHVFPQQQAKADVVEPTTFQEASRRFQSDFLQRALDDADWNVTEVAKSLDLARSHVYNLIRAFGLKRGTR